MNKPVDIPGIRLITVSGRIGAGSTSLAKNLAKTLNWKHIEGGEIFWEVVRTKRSLAAKETNLRPDTDDLLFDNQLKKILEEERHVILETKLAGFLAQGLKDVFKIVTLCEDSDGRDTPEIRIDRLVNREQIPMDDAKAEVLEREENDLAKWRSLYMHGDTSWIYWDRKYFDFVVNTFSHNAEESLQLVLTTIGHKKT
jgi:CMP/dCMP kinase